MIFTSYSLVSYTALQDYLKLYIPLVLHVAKQYEIDLLSVPFECDHIGYQSIGKEDYENCITKLLGFATKISEITLHDRRVAKFKFMEPIKIDKLVIPGIEIFEPKPGADIAKLKAGIEHIAFVNTEDFRAFYDNTLKNNVPVEKYVAGDDSTFFKTKFIDLVEIEFRNRRLI